jgi:hypothetical protein
MSVIKSNKYPLNSVPEDGASTFLQNIGELLADYPELHPRRQQSFGT